MVLKAFTEYTQGPLEVQYEPGGKVYRIPPITIKAASILHAEAAQPGIFQDQAAGDEHWAQRLVLGSLWDEMIDDGAPADFAARVYLTALADFQSGRDHAEHLFAEGVDPKVVAAFLETQTPPASTRSPRTGGGSSTKSPARTSTTTSKAPRRK